MGSQASLTVKQLLEAGSAADPLEFEAPYILPAIRETVTAWSPLLHFSETCNGVIHSKDEESCKQAYWPQKQLQKAIYGSVWHCIVLEKRQQSALRSNAPDESSELWEITEKAVAIKMISRARARKLRERTAEDPMKEVAAMQFLAPENGNSKTTHVTSSVEVLQDAIFMYSVMPYYRNGDLFSVVDSYNSDDHHGMPEPVARHFFRQILTGLNHLQSKGVFHRDLSLENIMVDRDACWIIDMGMCLRVPLDEPKEHATRGPLRRLLKPQGTCGKLNYMANEILYNKDLLDGYAADLWSTGVILFIMLTGYFPFAQASRTELGYETIVNGNLAGAIKGWTCSLSNEAVDLLQKMLQEDPRDRLTLAQVAAHPWVASGEATPPDFHGELSEDELL